MDSNIFKTIGNSFNERIRSPFYGAFIITWLVCNWRIIFAVLCFTSADRGSLNIVDFVETNYMGWYNCLVLPLLISVLIYILILPWVDYLTLWYSEWVRQEKISRKLKIQEAYVVDGKKYVELLKKFDDQLKLVDEYQGKANEANSQASEVYKNIANLDQENQNLKRQHQDISKQNELYSRRSDIQHRFEGRWAMTKKVQGAKGVTIPINVMGNTLYFVSNSQDDTKNDIMFADFDLIRKRFIFVLRSQADLFSFYDLAIINDNRFEGSENGRFGVYFEKDHVTINKDETVSTD